MSDDTPTSVYQYYDVGGRVLYVGITARGIRRAHEHAETKEWWPYCTGCAIEHFATRELALSREEELIKLYSPPFNTVHNSNKAAARALYEERRQLPAIRQRTRSPGGVVDEELKERRRQWYLLPAHEKRIAPCVRCGERPGVRGPECPVCKPLNTQSGTPNSAESRGTSTRPTARRPL